jgi:exopolysaccharide biosynthesis WecB/TagA/CpsF family protein
MDAAQALEIIERHWHLEDPIPLAVCSVNLDHIHHFGSGGRWHGTGSHHAAPGARPIEWLNLVDGAPVAARLERTTRTAWPRLAGSDLIGPILERAQNNGLRVGFLGGSPATHELLLQRLRLERPALQISGCWAPTADELADPVGSRAIARTVSDADTDVLVVCLGKPRQELWIAEYGGLTGARTLLAFGAVVDFLAGRVERAPRWVAEHGMEWAWRLILEPRRLAKRYLMQGPGAYLAVRRSPIEVIPFAASGLPHEPAATPSSPPRSTSAAAQESRFAGADDQPEVTVVTVTYNSSGHIRDLLDSLRTEAGLTRLRVIVADNGSADGTLDELADDDDITVISTGGNLGYAGGINAALGAIGPSEGVLFLNPDLTVTPGAVSAMLDRMRRSGAGIVVPAIVEGDGRLTSSLRREPSVSRALGDALFGERLTRRGAALSEIDWDETSYRFPHRVDWATGAALLVRGDLARRLGAWDERFFLYSEETEYFRRARDRGETVWYAPEATVVHSQGGSGVRAEFTALMAVNRVRYAEATGTRADAAGIRAVAILHAGLRVYQPAHRAALYTLLNRNSWDRLPHATVNPPRQAHRPDREPAR